MRPAGAVHVSPSSAATSTEGAVQRRTVSPQRSWLMSLGSVPRPRSSHGPRVPAACRSPSARHPATDPDGDRPVKIDPAAKPFTAMAAVPTVIAALARRPRTAARPRAPHGRRDALFFRDPDRTPRRRPVPDPDVVLAPADGMVMHAGAAQAGVAPRGRLAAGEHLPVRCSTCTSTARPYGGRVVEVTYRPGSFLAAYRTRARTRTSAARSSSSGVDGEPRRVVFRQIVGAAGPPDRDPHRAGQTTGHRPADGADEVRLPDGRLRAAGVPIST